MQKAKECKFISTDFVIVGAGVAGLYSALKLPKDKKIIVLSKESKKESNSFLAQGGMCVLRDSDDFQAYFEDTLKAGHYENKKESVVLMLNKSQDVLQDLLSYGVDFERNQEGFLYTSEGAHSAPRILFHKDMTGKEITSKLLAQVEQQENITLLEHTAMLDIIVEQNQCFGVICAETGKDSYAISATTTIWATGGIGGLYEHSTNFHHITGDALALALKHEIALKHLDYVQIHPTSFYSKKEGRRFLISESVRGEGGILLDKNGNRFTDELQPRDLLSAEIYAKMQEESSEFVYLSFENIDIDVITRHFPTIYEETKKEGYDITKEPIPVVPSQHYYMGGVAVDLNSETSMKGLYAVGETCCNGVHGANRLASNSLLESLVFAGEMAKYITISEYNDVPYVLKENLGSKESLLESLHFYRQMVKEKIGQNVRK